MTELERIEALPKEMLVPTDICKYLGCSAYTINVATRDGKNPFPFPVILNDLQVFVPAGLFYSCEHHHPPMALH